MENNKDLFELMTKMYSDFTTRMDRLETKIEHIDNKVDSLETKVDNLETKVKHIDNKVTIIEQEHGKKLTALFDGYTQNAQKLDNIQEEVSKHEEVILKRIK